MRRVVWIDGSGIRHVSTIRDNDPDSMAEYGIRHDPPELGQLDWVGIEESFFLHGMPFNPDEVKTTLYNTLLDRGLSSWNDVNKQQSGITAAVQATAVTLFVRPEHQKAFFTIMKPMLVRLYRSLS